MVCHTTIAHFKSIAESSFQDFGEPAFAARAFDEFRQTLASDLTDEQIVPHHYLPLLRWIDVEVDTMRDLLDHFLTESLREILRLGSFLDQAFHSIPPFPCFTKLEFPEQPLFEMPAPSAFTPTNQRLLPRLPVRIPPDWPPQYWFDEAAQRLLQIGIAKSELPRACADAHSGSLMPGVTIQEFVTQCESCVVSKAEEQHEFEPPTPGYLGIELDKDLSVVSRKGSNNRVEIERLLHWQLLEVFVKARGTWVSAAKLADMWEDLGGLPKPEKSTMTSDISRLRKRLSGLDLTIKNRRRTGWRLEETPDVE